MKILSREFNTKERFLLLFLLALLVGLAYYRFVDRPVRESLAIAESQKGNLEAELTTLNAQLAVVRRMRAEMEDITAGGTASIMESYNNSKAEIKLLNDILQEAVQYSIKFDDVARNGDQIRRSFSLQFITEDYETAGHIIEQLEKSQYRCLIGDVRCNIGRQTDNRPARITVSATATFFETMVGGVVDAGLPANEAAAN